MFAKNGEHDTQTWSQLALKILDVAPDRMAVLDIYASRFYPRAWSGALADALCPYLALAESLQVHNDQLVVVWAKKQTESLSKNIAEDRKRERRLDESFE